MQTTHHVQDVNYGIGIAIKLEPNGICFVDRAILNVTQMIGISTTMNGITQMNQINDIT
jgi:hypothetical protein